MLTLFVLCSQVILFPVPTDTMQQKISQYKPQNWIDMNNNENIPTRWWILALPGEQVFPSLTIHLETSMGCFAGLLCAKQWPNLNFSKNISFSTRKLLRNKPRKVCSIKKAESLTTYHMWCLGKQKGVYNLTIHSHDALPAQAADLSNPTQNLK